MKRGAGAPLVTMTIVMVIMITVIIIIVIRTINLLTKVVVPFIPHT